MASSQKIPLTVLVLGADHVFDSLKVVLAHTETYYINWFF